MSWTPTHAPRGNAEWTLGVPGVPRSTRSVSAAFPRRAWERAEKLRRWSPNLQIWQRRLTLTRD